MIEFFLLFIFCSCYAQNNSTVIIQPLSSSDSVYEILSFAPSSSNIVDGYIYKISTNGFFYIRQSYLQSVNSTQINFSTRVGVIDVVEFNNTTDVTNSNFSCSLTGQSLYSPLSIVDISPFSNTTVYNVSTTFRGTGNCSGLIVAIDTFLTTNNVNITTAEGFNVQSPLITNGAKFTVRIYNYPYKLKNSRLAIGLAYFTRKARNININEIQSQPNQIAISRLSYVPIVKVDNRFAALNPTELIAGDQNVIDPFDDGRDLTESYNLIYFKVDANQPKTIIWDPQIAIFPISTSTSDGLKLVVNVALLAITVFFFLIN